MTTVFWDYFSANASKWLELTLLDPAPALPEIIKDREVGHPKHFTRCPAFQEYYKNTYVIKCPIDMDITYDKDKRLILVDPQEQHFVNDNISLRNDSIGEGDSFLMSFTIGYVFIADDDCEVELKPASMHDSDFVNKTRLINGAFNVGKWYRPIEIAFEIKSDKEVIKIKRGDALAYVKFTPKDDSKVRIEQKSFPTETVEAVRACLFAKEANNKLPLKLLYELSERVKSKLWFNKGRCPFTWRKK